VYAGAVQDYIIPLASTRRGGRSLADIARSEVGTVAGVTAAIAIFFILDRGMAGSASSWSTRSPRCLGTFRIAMTIPLALFHGLFYMFQWRAGYVQEAPSRHRCDVSRGGIRKECRGVVDRGTVPALEAFKITIAMALYTIRGIGAAGLDAADASRLPEHVHEDRTIAFLVVGVMILNPKLEAPAFSVHRRRRSGDSRPALPLRLHHDRLRCDLGIPRAGIVRDDIEDDRP